MAGVAQKIAEEVNTLVADGRALLEHVQNNRDFKKVLEFAALYHHWYTRALAVVTALVPERLDEFRRQYERSEKRKGLDRLSYVVEDYLNTVSAPLVWDSEVMEEVGTFNVHSATLMKLNTQVEIIASCASRLTGILANIRGVLLADLFDSELNAARHLSKNGHLRAAGAVTGVAREGHLAQVCDNHGVKIAKKDPHINDFNEALKKAAVFDVVQWRGIQRLADIRNLCDHKKKREPTPGEVEELIDGVDKAIKTLT